MKISKKKRKYFYFSKLSQKNIFFHKIKFQRNMIEKIFVDSIKMSEVNASESDMNLQTISKEAEVNPNNKVNILKESRKWKNKVEIKNLLKEIVLTPSTRAMIKIIMTPHLK